MLNRALDLHAKFRLRLIAGLSGSIALVAGSISGLSAVERFQAVGATAASFGIGWAMLGFVLGIQLFNPLCPPRLFRFVCGLFLFLVTATFLAFAIGTPVVMLLDGVSEGIHGARPTDWAYSVAWMAWLVGAADCALWMLKRPRAAA